MLPRCGWGASVCWPGAVIGTILKIKAHNSWPIRMVKDIAPYKMMQRPI
jgi:hypothetical protein